jgi:hypothetical protein
VLHLGFEQISSAGTSMRAISETGGPAE